METVITVDPEVFGYLQKHAIPFLDTPNTTLRRLLGIDQDSKQPALEKGVPPELDELLEESKILHKSRAKAPKADLGRLAASGLVQNGESLFLIDYQGNMHSENFAIISGGSLEYKGKSFSMSNLAQERLAQLGFRSNSVRGPAHWANAKGSTIKDLWKQYLALHNMRRPPIIE